MEDSGTMYGVCHSSLWQGCWGNCLYGCLSSPKAPGVGSNGELTGPEAIRKAILVSLVEDLLNMQVSCLPPPQVGVVLMSEFPGPGSSTHPCHHSAACRDLGPELTPLG